jgi:phosphatidylserine decarboxylase
MQQQTPLISIPVEGWIAMLCVLLLALGLHGLGYPFAAGAALTLLMPMVVFFLDRDRQVPSKPRGVLAPVDGTIVYRRECHDPLLDREAVRIGIRVDLFGAYSLRSPVEGEHVGIGESDGHRASIIRTDEGESFVIAVRHGSLLGSAPVLTPVGDRIGQGRRCGLRRLAYEIDLVLPAGVRVEVPLGAQVRCGQTLIATMLRRNP